MEIHNTHNLSQISSEPNSLHSSCKEILERNKPPNDWSKLIKNNSSVSNRIMNEEDIDVTNKSYEKQSAIKSNLPYEKIDMEKIKNKNNKAKEEQNKNNIESKITKYLQGKYYILDNGIIVKDMNKTKNQISQKMKFNTFLIQKEKYNNNNSNNDNKLKNIFFRKKNFTKTPIQVKCIKKPDRSFITKLTKSKRMKSTKKKYFNKMDNSTNYKTNSYRESKEYKSKKNRLVPIPKIMLSKNLKDNALIKKLIRNKAQINENNNYSDNKIISLSSTSPKKFSIYSYKSLNDSLNNNNYLIINNKVKKRPLSSITKEIVEQNSQNKNLKNENYDMTSCNKSSYNNLKSRPISTMMNSKNTQKDKNNINIEDKVIYANENFIKELKELKECFKTCDSNNKTLYNPSLTRRNHHSVREYQKILKNQIKKIKKSNSEKIKNSDFYDFHPKDIIPLYNIEYKNSFENEKQNKRNQFCNNCGYRKHFGNESNCPVCITIKEQNQLMEEKSSNKYYYFPFKDKYDTINSQQYSISSYNYINNINTEHIFKNGHNTINLIYSKKQNILTTFNPYYLNNIYNSPKQIKKKIIRSKIRYKESKRSRSRSISKIKIYNAIQKYFE